MNDLIEQQSILLEIIMEFEVKPTWFQIPTGWPDRHYLTFLNQFPHLEDGKNTYRQLIGFLGQLQLANTLDEQNTEAG